MNPIYKSLENLAKEARELGPTLNFKKGMWGYDILWELGNKLLVVANRTKNFETMSVRDGKWCDKFGCCKVCDGEIPDGHSDNCDIWKLEKRINQLSAIVSIEDFTSHTELLESGPLKISGHTKVVGQAIELLRNAGSGHRLPIKKDDS